MGKITSIEIEKHNKNRSNIYIDGRYYCSLNNLTILQNRLEVGHVVTPSHIKEMQFDSEKDTAFERTLKYISKSMKTKHQIRIFLEQKGYLDDIIEYVIKKLSEYKYIDDEFYATSLAKELSQKYGEYGVRFKLGEKGLSDKNIDIALSKLNRKDYLNGALSLAKKYLVNKDINTNKDKLYNYLLQRGYDTYIIKEVISILKEE